MRAAGSAGKKTLVGAVIEVQGHGSGRLRLQVLKDASLESLDGLVTATTAPGAIVHTDGWRGYWGLATLGYQHRPRDNKTILPGEELPPRANRAGSNLKAWLHGTHRSVGDPHLQVYLDEYVFRHNRRRTPIAAFQTLLGLGALHPPTTYDQITKRTAA